MAGDDLNRVYDALAGLLQRHSAGLALAAAVPGSQAREAKRQLHLYGAHPVSIFGRPPQPVYVAGVIAHKGYVGFYSMPAYSHPQQCAPSPALAKARKGKSCFHIKDDAPATLAAVAELLAASIDCYRGLGWV